MRKAHTNETIYTYDAEGRLIKTNFTSNHGATEERLYTYNERGLLALESCDDGETRVYYYDDEKRLEKLSIMHNGQEMTERKYTYANDITTEDEYSVKKDGTREPWNSVYFKKINGLDKIVKVVNHLSSDGTVRLIEYDGSGHMIHSHNPDGFPAYDVWKTYNNAGNIVREIMKDANGIIFHESVYHYEYDDRGNKLKVSVEGDGSCVTSYKYDVNDRVISSYCCKGDECTSKTFEYDVNGNVVHERIVRMADLYGCVVNETKCFYDEEGRLIRRMEGVESISLPSSI